MSFLLTIIAIYLTFFLVAALILLALVPESAPVSKDESLAVSFLPKSENLESALDEDLNIGTKRPYAVNVLSLPRYSKR